ncbi:molybdopterin converting factor subunit 1 [Teredinibacter sp. KSP-S5-2]|uniref:molybdopterin converting factor subunit 1 n=1 Tax=Teredinibacter sp. KSP-S5-2 TaxID=3034506 RepID=UPI002934AD43|nr:molybdopterin converting factor subunit 1 [Teredinibacter sp. KSP-S5-2]WNO11525.1 molybdopterin converting factor subunit 1 [Teredinibacter sp. KSP-S5-2]
MNGEATVIKVVFFGQLRELLACPELNLEASEVQTVAELRQTLKSRFNSMEEYLAEDKALVAVNQTMANDAATLSAGDEVAFFPPVTGG